MITKPRIEIDEKQLQAICRLKPTIADCAAFFDCSEDTVLRRIQEYGYPNFAAFREKSMVQTRFTLIRRALEKADKGDNTMLKYCLANLCGWSERSEQALMVGSDQLAKILSEIDGNK